MFFLFAAGSSTVYQACSFGGIDANNWIQINALLLLVAMSLGGIFYAFSNILPARQMEKMKGLVKAEVFQGVIGIIIIMVLVTSAVTWCNIGASLTSSSGIGSSNPMSFSQAYLQNLLFTKGLSLFGSMYSETALLFINGIVLNHIAAFINNIEASFLPVQITVSTAVLDDYALAFGTAGFTIFSVIFGIIFVIYLLLPVVSALALTVVVPTAIAMRMLTFVGPKIREAADIFLSIAIAAYFIFPLMIVMNSMLVSYLYTSCGSGTGSCNPYSNYLGTYTLATLPSNSLFSNSPASFGGAFSLPKNFFAGILSGNGGFFNTVVQIFKNAVMLPQVFIGFAQEIAELAFQGVFLLGLDILVTVAFAQALSKGLNSVSNVVSGGPFWSD